MDKLNSQIGTIEQKMRKCTEEEEQYKDAARKLISVEIKPKKSSTDLNARAVNLKKRLQNDDDPNIEQLVTEYKEFEESLMKNANEICGYLEKLVSGFPYFASRPKTNCC